VPKSVTPARTLIVRKNAIEDIPGTSSDDLVNLSWFLSEELFWAYGLTLSWPGNLSNACIDELRCDLQTAGKYTWERQKRLAVRSCQLHKTVFARQTGALMENLGKTFYFGAIVERPN
jgi:hypothetical protein